MARQMKDSGIAWIGEIPESWRLQKGKYLYRQRSEKGNSVALQLLSPTQKYGVIPQSLYEKISGMKPVQLDAKADLEQFKSIYAGDFCISLRSFQGGFEYSQYNGVVSPAYQVFYRQADTTSNTFYRYIFKEIGFIGYMNSFTKSFRDGKSIAFDDFAGTLLPVPPIAEQQRIAAFLDHRCAEIDAVIERTKATIEEYKKLKQAIITEAVTKGVHGARPMKDSRIEWLGSVPLDWTECRIKNVIFPQDKPITESDEVITCFRDGEVTLRKNRREDGFTVSFTEHGYHGVDIGDLVIHGMDAFAGAIGCSDSRGKTTPVVHVCNTAGNNRYFMYFLRSMAYGDILMDLSNGVRIRSSDYRNFAKLGVFGIVVPPIDEQNEIVDFLDKRCVELDTLIAKKTTLLTELEAYKKSLIYEYVTGKKEVV